MTAKPTGGAGIWLAGIVLGLILFGAVINRDKAPELTPAQQAAEAARREAKREAEARRELAAIERTERRDTALTWVVVIVAGAVGAAVVGGVIVVIVYAVRRSGWHRPNDLGLLPVSVRDRAAPTRALEAFHVARIADARRELPPHTYSPHNDYRLLERLEAPSVPELPSAVEDGPVPTFGELVETGVVGPHTGAGIVYGWTSQGALKGPWDLMYSAAYGGYQGSGKTIGMVFHACQALMDGVEVWIADPDLGDPQSLGTRLEPLMPWITNVAETPADIVAQAQKLGDVLRRRIDKKLTGERRILWFFDEWPSTIADDDVRAAIEPHAKLIVQRGRKRDLNMIAAGQEWTKDAASSIRNNLTAGIAFRMRREEVQYMTGRRASGLPEDTYDLGPGACYLIGRETARMRIPAMSKTCREEMEAVADLLGGGSKSVIHGVIPGAANQGFRTGSGAIPQLGQGRSLNQARTTPRTTLGTTPESPPANQSPSVDPETRDAILRAFLAGQSAYAIVKELNGGVRIVGPAQQQATQLVNGVIRWAMETGYRPDGLGNEEVAEADDDLDPSQP